MLHKLSSLYGMLHPSKYDDAVCVNAAVFIVLDLQFTTSPYVKVQRPGLDLLKAGTRL